MELAPPNESLAQLGVFDTFTNCSGDSGVLYSPCWRLASWIALVVGSSFGQARTGGQLAEIVLELSL